MSEIKNSSSQNEIVAKKENQSSPSAKSAEEKNNKQEITVKISPSIILFIAAFLAGLFVLQRVKMILYVLFIAYIISVGLNKAIAKLESKYHWRRGLAVAITYVLFVLLIIAFFSFVLPPLVNETIVLLNNANLSNAQTQEELFGFQLNLNDLGKIISTFGNSLSKAVGVVSSTFSGVFVGLTTIIISLYITLDRPSLPNKLERWVKDQKTLKLIKDFLSETDEELGNWLRGEIILMSIIGALTFIATMIIGIPYAVPIAMFAALMEIVPNVGPTLTAVLAALVALISSGWPAAIAAIIACVIIQQLENNLIVPKIMKKNVDINPLTSIICILSGASLFGMVGALLAIPIFIVCRSFYSAWIKNH